MNGTTDATLPGLRDIERAADRLAGIAVRTPLLESPMLNRLAGGRVLVKAEPLQRTGSFKFRGAYNKLSALPPERRNRGVVAFSSGNHAQGVAAAAQLHGVRATIVMPADAPLIKLNNTRALGAEVVTYDRDREDREAISRRIVSETGAELVPPFDDPEIIAGQGTIGLEIAEQADALGVRPDLVLVPCSGGGLVAGVSTAIAERLPGVPVYSVEPEGFDDMARSLRAGEPVQNSPGARSICDALLAPSPGTLTFAVNRRTLAGGLVVSDEAVRRAMAVAFETLKLVVEPGGAVGLAAILDKRIDLAGTTAVVVCSGGNVDGRLFAEALAG